MYTILPLIKIDFTEKSIDDVYQRFMGSLRADQEPLLEEEKQGQHKVFYVVAAHFVMGAFLRMLWYFERLFLKSSSRRRRYNVLGAYSVKGTDLVTVTNVAYINSDTIVDLLIKIKQENTDIPLTLVMDNARYQRCDKVTSQAKALDILFLPPLLAQFDLD